MTTERKIPNVTSSSGRQIQVTEKKFLYMYEQRQKIQNSLEDQGLKISVLMRDHASVHAVHEEYKNWLLLYDKYLLAESEYRVLLTEEDLQQHDAVHSDRLVAISMTKSVGEQFLVKEYQQHQDKPYKEPHDTVSQMSKGSRVSGGTHVSGSSRSSRASV